MISFRLLTAVFCLTAGFMPRSAEAAVNPPITPIGTYCTTVDGSTNNTSCIQAAVTAVCAQSPPGGDINFGSGIYVVDTININCDNVGIIGVASGGGTGTNDGTTFLLTNSASAGDGFNWGGLSSTRLNGARFRHAKIDARNRASNLNAISMALVQHGTIEDVTMWNPGSAIAIHSGIQFDLKNIYLDQVRTYGVLMDGSFPSSCSGNIANCPYRLDVVNIEDMFIGVAAGSETSAVGLRVTNFDDTINVRNVQVVNPNYGLLLDCGTGNMDACPHFMNFLDFEVDFVRSQAIRASDFQEIHCYMCYFNGYNASTGSLLSFFNSNLGSSTGVQLIGGKALGSGVDVVDLAVQNSHVEGMDIYNGNLANHGGQGVHIRNSAGQVISLIQIIGNNFCTFAGSTPSTMGGVLADSGTTRIIANANMYYGCSSGFIDNTGGGATSNNNNLP